VIDTPASGAGLGSAPWFQKALVQRARRRHDAWISSWVVDFHREYLEDKADPESKTC